MNIVELNETLINRLKEERISDENISYKKYLFTFLDYYSEQICNICILKKDIIKAWCNGIKECYEKYETADIVGAITIMKQLFSQYSPFLSMMTIGNTEDTKHWYRMRILEKNQRLYEAKEMFHVPFDKRGKLQNQRYSISGYPCLYIGKSIWACWEEMHEPDMRNVCVSRLELCKEMDLLNLCWPTINENEINDYEINRSICTWPLIIACSIKTLNPQNPFKPEYIIPQLVMITIKNYTNIKGCIWTSTQHNNFFGWDNSLLCTAAIPVNDISDSSNLCQQLSSYFKVTDSTKEEYYRLMGAHSYAEVEGSVLTIGSFGKYKNSNFGLIEKNLKGTITKSL